MKPATGVITAGIDVGGRRKGLHAVALRDGCYLAQFGSREAGAVASWCREMGAWWIGVDAPCRWSTDGRARPAERALMHAGISCFATPTRQRAEEHPRDYYGWMLVGAEVFAALAATHPLFDGTPESAAGPVSFETFPQAIACALAGEIVRANDKHTARRRLLEQAGIDTATLTNGDLRDAALCALAAWQLALGRYRLYGEAATGLIVTPD